MSFSDFSKVESIKSLNDFLADKSYIDGSKPTQADVTTYKAFQKEYPQFTRWFNHIASFTEEFNDLPAGNAPAASKSAAAPSKAAAAEEDEDDVDLFGSDDEDVDEEAEKLKQQRLAEYAAKKAAKGPKPAAKSIVTLDVKPWDDETDLDQLLANLKAVEMEGLTWGAHQWIPVGYGIKKLQINLVVEDALVSLDDLQAAIEEDEDHVQSTDIAAMQKL
ncbi:EFB1 [Candida jiufengensis]|uniref:EFB1 n=1 Tax=Candida jiufengensis TaxID=497108 RepID=UPI002224B1DD|nr:EFB1 [Candida jiufengensis]KAI5949898.1 EFB1 [Candida jiufengensis]